MENTSSFAVKGNFIHTPRLGETELFEASYLLCIDGKTEGIYKELPEKYKGLPVKDYGDRLIYPGMVDLHIHAPQYTYRGMCMDLELLDWLNEYTFPEEERYADLEYARRAYGIFCESLKKGATTRAAIFATRHIEATELLMELMEETGLYSYVGKVNMDREASEKLTEQSAEMSAFQTFAWINKTKNKFKRTYPILTPRFIPCCTDKLMEELRQIQMAYEIPVQSHLSENRGEIEFVKKLRPNNDFYGDAYDEYDLFGKNRHFGKECEVKTLMAHCVWSDEEETRLIKDNGVFVAHCPISNMNLTSGIAPIRKYLDRGIRVGLGSDVAGGNSDSMFRSIVAAVQVSKLYFSMVDGTSKPLSFADALYIATKGGGEFFGKVGSFEAGYEFDAVVIDDSVLPSPRELTLRERAERAVYLALDEKSIVSKYVSGVCLFDGRGENK